MTTTKETKKAVQEAAERLEEARQNAQRIVDAMAVQPAVFDAQLLAKAREKVEDLGAAVMLGEASREALEEARREASDLEIEAAAAEFNARQIAEGRAGLERRLSEAQGVIEDAEQDLIEATRSWLIACAEEAERTYTEAAQKACDAFARVEACNALLKIGGNGFSMATNTHIDFQAPVIGPASLAATAGKLRGGIRGVVGPTVFQLNEAGAALRIELKDMGARLPEPSRR